MAKNRYAVGTASRYEGGAGDERGTGQEPEADLAFMASLQSQGRSNFTSGRF
jgi:hypothetical protein